jgi:hypothetical protein
VVPSFVMQDLDTDDMSRKRNRYFHAELNSISLDRDVWTCNFHVGNFPQWRHACRPNNNLLVGVILTQGFDDAAAFTDPKEWTAVLPECFTVTLYVASHVFEPRWLLCELHVYLFECKCCCPESCSKYESSFCL